MSDFRRGVNEIFTLLGCYATYIDSWLPKFPDNMSVPSSNSRRWDR